MAEATVVMGQVVNGQVAGHPPSQATSKAFGSHVVESRGQRISPDVAQRSARGLDCVVFLAGKLLNLIFWT